MDISKCVSESLGSVKYKIKTINYVASEVKLFMNNELNKSTKLQKRQNWAYNRNKLTSHTHTKIMLTTIVLDKRRKTISWKVYGHWNDNFVGTKITKQKKQWQT